MWTHDLRQVIRLFRREPSFAATAIVTLALGIGVNTALFAVVDAALLRPLPFERADDLVVLRHRDVRSGLTKPDIAIGDFVDLRARQRSLESLVGFGGFQSTLFGNGEPRRVEGASVTADGLDMLRVRPALGRPLRADDGREGAAPVVLVGDDFWRKELGADPHVLSRSIQLGSVRYTVVGVLPAGFRVLPMPRTDVLVAQPVPMSPPAQRRSGWTYAMGRLRPGITREQADAELASISRQLEAQYPDQNQGSRYEALSLRDSLVGETRRPLLLLLAAAGFVLLIACANVGNLLLARALARHPELALRAALGASRQQLVAHVLAEGAGVALAGAAVGVAVAWYAAPVLAALVPDAGSVPGLETVGVGGRVLAFALVAAVLSAIGSSAVAAIAFTRAERGALLTQRRGTMSPGATMAASSLVVAEVALAVVLLAGAGLALRSFRALLAVDPGFRTDGVLTVTLALPDGRYDSEESRQAFFRQAFAAIDALPGVESTGAAMVMPLTGNNWSVPLQRVDRPLPPGERAPDVGWQLASRGYFESLRIPLRAGRLFDARDASGPAVVIVSDAVSERYFPGETALGHRIDLGDQQAEIVGIVGNIRRGSLADEPRADLYFPFEKATTPQTTVFVRTKGDPLAVLPAARAAVQRVEPQAVLFETRTMAAIAEESAAVTRLAMRLLGGFAIVALLLAAVGVYGVMSYRVRRRTRELGTRMALGATTGHVTRLVMRQAVWLAGIGLLAGTALALVLARTLASALYGVPPWDPITLAATACLLGVATLIAGYFPARRAARVAPASVLASE